jgi:hypothetical protein
MQPLERKYIIAMINSNPRKTISRLVSHFGGFSALGREIGVSAWAVQKWFRQNHIPAERVLILCDLAKAADIATTPSQLRPDLYPRSMFLRAPAPP